MLQHGLCCNFYIHTAFDVMKSIEIAWSPDKKKSIALYTTEEEKENMILDKRFKAIVIY